MCFKMRRVSTRDYTVYDVHYQLLPNRDVDCRAPIFLYDYRVCTPPIDFKNRHEICAGKKRIG